MTFYGFLWEIRAVSARPYRVHVISLNYNLPQTSNANDNITFNKTNTVILCSLFNPFVVMLKNFFNYLCKMT